MVKLLSELALISSINRLYLEKEFVMPWPILNKLYDICFQSIRIIDTYEIQEIKISYRGCNETDYGDCEAEDYFSITYDGETTGKIGSLSWACYRQFQKE